MGGLSIYIYSKILFDINSKFLSNINFVFSFWKGEYN